MSVRIGQKQLRSWAADVLGAAGLAPESADVVAGHLVEADSRGTHSHGTDLLPHYHRGFTEGHLDSAGAPEQASGRGAIAVVDGRNTLGHLAADLATALAMELAREHGIAMVTVRNSNHFGMAGSWPLKALRRGLIGYATTNGPQVMAPWGGRRPAICNNPFAWGIPAGEADPILLDLACTAGARGRVRLARDQGEPIPEGWALDAEGRPTTDAAAALDGVMLPFAEHKGSGIAIVDEILSASLSGAAFLGAIGTRTMASSGVHPSWKAGHVITVIDPEAFRPLDEFLATVDAIVAELKATPLAAGASELLMPGERGFRSARDAAAHGVAIPDAQHGRLARFGRELGLTFPEPMVVAA